VVGFAPDVLYSGRARKFESVSVGMALDREQPSPMHRSTERLKSGAGTRNQYGLPKARRTFSPYQRFAVPPPLRFRRFARSPAFRLAPDLGLQLK